jgi:hypothetical protein
MDQRSLDSSTRRAFPLDSRSVWIEQQIVHQVLLPKENLPIGPSEYSPEKPQRHITTPVLGKYRGPADHFRNFNSSVSTRSLSPNGRSPVREENSEYTTIFHHHENRNPYDPKLNFGPTPGPYLAHDSVLAPKSVHGTNTVHTLEFGNNFADRNPTKKALPDYDINYDSLQTRKAPVLTTFPKSKRIHIPKKGENPFPGSQDEYDEDETKEEGEENQQQKGAPQRQMRLHSPSITDLHASGSFEHMSVLQWRCSLVQLPKLKTRAPPRIVFQTESYRHNKKKMPTLLTPKVVKQKAKVDLFNHILTIPRAHKSSSYK